MSTRMRRGRTSTSATTPPESTQATAELQVLFTTLSNTLGAESDSKYPELSTLINQSQSIRLYLIASSENSRTKDDFRHLNGFQLVLDTLRAFSGFYHPSRRTFEEKSQLFELLEIILGVLGQVFRSHHGNRRYFKRRVEGGGWAALGQTIASIGIGGNEPDICGEAELLGRLLSFALDDKRFGLLCRKTAEFHPSFRSPETLPAQSVIKDVPRSGSNMSTSPGTAKHTSDEDVVKTVTAKLADMLQENALLRNNEIVPIIIDFWKTIPRDPKGPVNPAALVVILSLLKISEISSHNLAALHATGCLSALLPMAFDSNTPLTAVEQSAVVRLCESLIELGISNLKDAQYLACNLSPAASEFLLRALKVSSLPSYIQFDLSLHGFASIELPALGRTFPPQSEGYTFMAWIHIDHFDQKSHTTIFGAFDPTQTCFVLAYLEQDTHNLILQTSVTSSRPSVRFKSFKFQERKWYHIAIVHRRPRTMTSSKASLFVDGEFAEQVKCQYPASSPLTNGSTESFASFTSSTSKQNPVQAFLGTPQDLSAQLGRGVVFSRWSLASAYLLEDLLSDDLIAVYHRLGPRYNGNFQDCLGSFQTYEASAALGRRNQLMHPGRDADNSEISVATREKGSTLLPETRILLSIQATAVYGEDDQHAIQESQMLRGLNKKPSNNLFQLTHNSGTSVAVNAAIPSVNEALIRAQGTSILTGEPVVVVPQSLDCALWRLGGFTGLALKLVENAKTRESIVRAVEILFESIRGSWRNSEAIERENGYPILGALIRGKIGAGVVVSSESQDSDTTQMSVDEKDKLSFQLLSVVLEFVGYNQEKPEDSFITNPLAYRILLVDFDMWRKSAPNTQRLYYRQFIVFGVNSKHHHINGRRLYHMRIVKRFLDALKSETFSREIFPSFLEALITLVRCNMTAEVFRSLALFITYAFHKPALTSASRNPKNATFPTKAKTMSDGPRRPTINTVLGGRDGLPLMLTRRELGIKVLEMYASLLCEKSTTLNIQRFAKTVTNKWLLYLLAEDDPEVVVHGSRILARLLVVHGSVYTSRFASKSGGFTVLRHRLRRWWDVPTLWPICFSILFAYDVADIDFEKSFELFSLLEIFHASRVVNAGMLPVITAMLQHGLKDVLRNQDDPDSPLSGGASPQQQQRTLQVSETTSRRRSMSLTKELEARKTPQPKKERLGGQATVLHTVIRFFTDLHSKSPEFRDFANNSDYVRLLLGVLFPVVVSTDAVSPETELNSRDSALTFEGDDVIIRPISRIATMPAPIVRTSMVDTELAPSPATPRAKPLRRGSSFILLTARPSEFSPSSARLNLVVSPKKKLTAQKVSNGVVEGLLELVVNVFVDQVMVRKDFPGFGLAVRIPPGFQEHQAYFESYLLRNTISQLSNTIQLDQKSLWEPKLIQNMARFVHHIGEAVFEGWFLGGAEPLLDFAGTLLEYLQRPEVSKIKSVRLCNQAILTIKSVFLRIVLLRLSELDSSQVPDEEALAFMNKLLYWQTVVLSSEVGEDDLLKLICYQLYIKLVDSREMIRLAASDLWRILLVQKPEETSNMLQQEISSEQRDLTQGFQKLMELDNETFVSWVDGHRGELDALFFGAMSRTWEEFVNAENAKTEEASKSRIVKRREKLKQWHKEDLNDEDILLRHDVASTRWMENIYVTEHQRHQRFQQDQQDNFTFLVSTFSKMDRDLHRPCAVFDNGSSTKWKLDRTEGRNRMRMRMLPDREAPGYDYQPKRKATDPTLNGALKLDTNVTTAPSQAGTPASALPPSQNSELGTIHHDGGGSKEAFMPEEEFELVDNPNELNQQGSGNGGDEVEDQFEDKNRKVMRSIQQGDKVQAVYNVSRVTGLEACEGLLILGKDCLYLMDNLFVRADGEIVNVLQAPKEQRDPYLQMISGHKASDKRSQPVRAEQETKNWRWNDLISISKRRFLFRDVAIEVFFTDGRSYLLTAIVPSLRDDIFSKLTSKAPHTTGSSSLPNPEDSWRLEALKVSEETPSSGFGSKFSSIFNSSAWNPAMRRWAKGEISNFHYLMLVNTMAGRTFNDLTQYPVFPWVLADYTSEELDLSNPASFRDLSKPMGAQHISRQADFIERYKSFAEMGDHNAPPFHYGTHYSSAMIVTSYLIRLQPFVQSYLLLQGGNFDHPDRLFYSIEKAWASASKDNMTDVRELIPEFFYLPEFLTNNNGYNFGLRQGNGGSIDNVVLPRWAKGDPKIFIAKHREALESPYVSQNLHLWIDLVFGAKQRGEAAIENTNVFHHLSYHGARDLDAITDQIERLATIGIIHNFGQTPHQVFYKPHAAREEMRHKFKRLDTAADSLTRLPFPLMETHERVSALTYSPKLDRLLCSTAFKLNLPPYYDKYIEWGFADCSVRFYFTDSKKQAGLFENLHQGQLSAALLASSQLLITAGEDCTVSAHTIATHSGKPVELQPRASLFGHKTPVNVLAVSKSFSTLVSASLDGLVLLWDLNQMELVRRLTYGRQVECASINDISGTILLCRGQRVTLYTLNGDLVLDQHICVDHDDYIYSCAFYEGTGNEWLESELIFTGHRRGVVNIWKKVVAKPIKGRKLSNAGTGGKWELELVKRLDHVDTKRSQEDGGQGNSAAAITCIRPMAQIVYTGDEDGRVYEWDIVQRER